MNKNAFTLVELLVGITISILLMTSIGVFVSTWMSNIVLQQKIVNNNQKFNTHISDIQEMFKSSQWLVGIYSSGVLLKTSQNFDRWGYSYIWTQEITDHYCQEPDTQNTQHVFTSSFIPFEEIGEDINTNFSDIESSEVTVWSIVYRSNMKNHQILDVTNNVVAVWKDIFWDKMSEWSVWTGVFLNSPTGMVQADWNLVFSDTLNNRILYLSWGLVYTLLDQKNGLKEPTGLAYSWGILYISNSAKGEVLKLSSEEYLSSNPDLNINFTPEWAFNADRFRVQIFTGSINLTWPSSISDVTVDNPNAADEVIVVWNNLDYYFINNFASESVQASCTGVWLIESWEDIINCTMSGTWELANRDSKTFVSGANYSIDIQNITPLLSTYQHYYSKLTFKNWTNSTYQKYFPYFTQWDGDIFTKDDNTLEVFTWGLDYPTGLGFNSWNLVINTFEDRTVHTFNVDWTHVWSDSWILNPFSEWAFNDYTISSILDNPVNDINITNAGNLLNIKLDYYKYLNCHNPDEKVKKTLLFKKSF